MCNVMFIIPKEKVELIYLPCLAVDGLSESRPDGPEFLPIDKLELYPEILELLKELEELVKQDGRIFLNAEA